MLTENNIQPYYTPLQTERWWIEKAREDPYYFIWYVTGLKPAMHHRIWLSNFFHPERKRVNVIGPRESAKTTIGVYGIAWAMSKNPLATFGILSVSSDQAKDRLGMLRTLIRDNQRYRNVFPWITIDTDGKPDTQTQFSIRHTGFTRAEWIHKITTSQSELVKNPSIFSGSVGGKVVIGKRISGILLMDDIMDGTFANNEAQKRLQTWIIKEVIPTVQEHGRVWNIGTRWMVGDIYGYYKSNPAWFTVEIPAIMTDEDGTEYSYWSDYWSLARLYAKKDEMMNDPEFAVMYLCDPYALSAGLFTKDKLKRGIPIGTDLYNFKAIYVVNDHAISLRTQADFNVSYIVGITPHHNVCILEGERWKSSEEDSVLRIAALADTAVAKYKRLNNILFENVGFQATFMQTMITERPDLPVAGVVPKGDKLHRASIVSTWMNRDLLWISEDIPFRDVLVDEWIEFPASAHDDTLDPIGLLFQYTNLKPISARRAGRKASGSKDKGKRITFLR
jgi:predicted phage terminase large subunit-like protein